MGQLNGNFTSFYDLPFLINILLFIPIVILASKNKSRKEIAITQVILAIFLIFQIFILVNSLINYKFFVVILSLFSVLVSGVVIYLFSIKKDDIPYEEIIRQLPGHVYWKNKEGVFLGSNTNNWRDFGFKSLSEFKGKTDYTIFSKEEADLIRSVDQEVVSTSKLKIAEEYFTKNSEATIYLSHKIPLKDSQSNTIGILGVSIDITTAKKEVSDQLEMLENIIAIMPGHVYWLNKDGTYLGCNDNQAKAIGLNSRKDIIGKTNEELRGFLIPEILDPINKEVMETGHIKIVEEPAILRNGTEAVFLSSKVPLRNSDNEIIGMVGVSIDITDRKKAEALKAEREILEKQLTTVKTLAATIAHELRTPLAAIVAGAEGAKEYLPDLISAYQLAAEHELPVSNIRPSQFKLLSESMDAIIEETRYSNNIINMLLTNVGHNNINPSEFQICSMVHCIDVTLERYPFQSGQRELIQWDRSNDFSFMGKEMLTVHIFFNLLKNAIYYVKAANKANGKIQIRLEKGDVYNKVYFRDSGKGIAADILPKIFDLFFSRTQHGSGVGLAFCRMVMEAYGGKIECKSVEGDFAEFILSFPVISGDRGRK